MAFNGVRSSWLILLRNWVFDRFARSAAPPQRVCLAVETRVVERHRAPRGEIARQHDLIGGEELLALRADEGERALHSRANNERYDQERPKADLAQDAQALFAVRGQGERAGLLRHEHRSHRRQHVSHPVGRDIGHGRLVIERVRQRLLPRVRVHHRQAMDHAARLDHVDDAPCAGPGQRHSPDRVARGVLVERRRELATDV